QLSMGSSPDGGAPSAVPVTQERCLGSAFCLFPRVRSVCHDTARRLCRPTQRWPGVRRRAHASGAAGGDLSELRSDFARSRDHRHPEGLRETLFPGGGPGRPSWQVRTALANHRVRGGGYRRGLYRTGEAFACGSVSEGDGWSSGKPGPEPEIHAVLPKHGGRSRPEAWGHAIRAAEPDIQDQEVPAGRQFEHILQSGTVLIMEELRILPARNSPRSPTLRDIAAIFFRHRRLLAGSFLAVWSAG